MSYDLFLGFVLGVSIMGVAEYAYRNARERKRKRGRPVFVRGKVEDVDIIGMGSADTGFVFENVTITQDEPEQEA